MRTTNGVVQSTERRKNQVAIEITTIPETKIVLAVTNTGELPPYRIPWMRWTRAMVKRTPNSPRKILRTAMAEMVMTTVYQS